MKKKTPRWETFLTQFSYDHRKFGSQMDKIRKSAGELSRLLDNMAPGKKES